MSTNGHSIDPVLRSIHHAKRTGAPFQQSLTNPFKHPFTADQPSRENEMKGLQPMIRDMETRDRLLTAAELAHYLGVPVTTLYQWRYRREGPPGFRMGRHLRYRWTEVEAWIERQIRDANT